MGPFSEQLPLQWIKKKTMLDLPSQYVHYCLVLLGEVYCVIV